MPFFGWLYHPVERIDPFSYLKRNILVVHVCLRRSCDDGVLGLGDRSLLHVIHSLVVCLLGLNGWCRSCSVERSRLLVITLLIVLVTTLLTVCVSTWLIGSLLTWGDEVQVIYHHLELAPALAIALPTAVA